MKECGVDIQHTCETGRKDRRNAMHWAARNGHTEVCAWLHRPVDVNSEDCTTADATGAEAVAAGVDVDACTTDGTVAFHWACWQGQFGKQECCALTRHPALDRQLSWWTQLVSFHTSIEYGLFTRFSSLTGAIHACLTLNSDVSLASRRWVQLAQSERLGLQRCTLGRAARQPADVPLAQTHW